MTKILKIKVTKCSECGYWQYCEEVAVPDEYDIWPVCCHPDKPADMVDSHDTRLPDKCPLDDE